MSSYIKCSLCSYIYQFKYQRENIQMDLNNKSKFVSHGWLALLNVWAASTLKKKKIWLTTSAPVWNIEGWWECFTAYSKMYECSCCGPKSQNPVYQQEMHKSDAEKSSEEVLIQWVTSPAKSEREIVKDVVLAQLLLLVLLLCPCKPILSMGNLLFNVSAVCHRFDLWSKCS